MNKKLYLRELRTELSKYRMSEMELTDILNDYDQMYEDALERGLSEEEIYDTLGSPIDAARELKGTMSDYINPIPRPRRNGTLNGNENISKYRNKKIVSLSPIFATIIFFILGFSFKLWHPGWLVFLIIPVIGILCSPQKPKKMILSISPFIVLAAFILIGYFTAKWQYIWLIFFIIPILGILTKNPKQ